MPAEKSYIDSVDITMLLRQNLEDPQYVITKNKITEYNISNFSTVAQLLLFVDKYFDEDHEFDWY